MSFLDPTYSTTRLLTAERPEGLKALPVVAGRVAEGGLRTKGWFKSSISGKPLISIIVVVLNRAGCFENCIKSVLSQSYDNVELIIVDGASTDGTLDLLYKYDNQIDYWVSEPDQGLYYAMNNAVDVAAGDWLYFIGSDDILLECLADMVPHLSDNRVIYYGDVYGTRHKRIYNGPFSTYRISAHGIKHQGMFFPKEVFTHLHYDVSYKIGADWDLSLRCLIDYSFGFVYVPELIAAYNDIDGLSTQEAGIAGGEYCTFIRRRLGVSGLFYIGRWAVIRFLETVGLKEPLRRLAVACFGYSLPSKERLLTAQRLMKKGIDVADAAEATHLSVDDLNRYKATSTDGL